MASTEDARAATMAWDEMAVTDVGVVEWLNGAVAAEASGRREAGGGTTDGAFIVPVLRSKGAIKEDVELCVYKKTKREAEVPQAITSAKMLKTIGLQIPLRAFGARFAVACAGCGGVMAYIRYCRRKHRTAYAGARSWRGAPQSWLRLEPRHTPHLIPLFLYFFFSSLYNL